MVAITTLQVIVLVLIAIRDASAGCQKVPLVQTGYRARTIRRQNTTVSILSCTRACSRTDGCNSINFNKKKNICELLEGGDQQPIYLNDDYDFVGDGIIKETVSCPTDPNSIPHSIVTVNTARSEATYSCKTSYAQTSGVSLVYCVEPDPLYDDGPPIFPEWENPTIECKAQCQGKINDVANAVGVIGQDHTHVTYSCTYPAVRMFGDFTYPCVEQTREWAKPNLECKAAVCKAENTPMAVQHAQVEVNSERSIATYTCKDTYVQTSGKDSVLCKSDGSVWYQPTITCKAACFDELIPDVENAAHQPNDLHTQLTYRCITPPMTEETVYCEDQPRKWSQPVLQCYFT